MVIRLSAAHSVITHIWGTEGGPARYAIHFGYPIGSMLGPLMAIPFVYGEEATSNATTAAPAAAARGVWGWYRLPYGAVQRYPGLYDDVDDGDDDGDGAIVESKHFDDGSSIEYVYLIVGLFIAVNAAVFMLLQLLRKHLHVTSRTATTEAEKTSFKQVLTPSEWADGDGRFGATFLVLMCVYFVLQTATHKGTQEYLVTYAVDSEMFSATEAATLNSVVYAAGARCILLYGNRRLHQRIVGGCGTSGSILLKQTYGSDVKHGNYILLTVSHLPGALRDAHVVLQVRARVRWPSWCLAT